MSIDVFISYAHPDRHEAAQLVELLEGHGFNVWWDEMLEAGEKFRPAITKKLEDARKVVVLWTKHSVEDRDFVWDEASRAKQLEKLVPCKLEGIDHRQIPIGFGELHTISIKNWNADQDRLIAALRKPSPIDRPVITHGPALEDGPPLPIPEFASQPKRGFLKTVLEVITRGTKNDDPNFELGLLSLERGEWWDAYNSFSNVIESEPDAPLAYERRAQTLAQLGEWQACFDDCNRALERNAADPVETTLFGGAALIRLGRWQEADSWYSDVIQRGAQSSTAYQYRAYARAQDKAWQAALEDAEQALRIDSAYSESHWLKGVILIELKQPADAVVWLNDAISQFPDMAHPYYARGLAHAHLSGWPETIADCSHALELPGAPSEAFWLRGFARMQHANRDIGAALQDFRAAIEHKPDYENAIHALLWALAQQSNWQAVLNESDAILKRAIEWGAGLVPQMVQSKLEHAVLSPNIRTVRAEAYRMLSLYPECLAECSHVLRAQPNFPDPLRVRALAYLQQNKFDDALQDLDQALRIDANDAHSLCYRGYIRRVRFEHAAALADLDKAAALAPDLALSFYHRGWTHLAIADYAVESEASLASAEENFQRLLEIAKASGEGHAGLAETCRRRRKLELGLKHVATAQSIEPGLAQALIVRGWIYIDSKDFEKAQESFIEAIGTLPTNESQYAHYGAGECARYQERWEEALRHYSSAIESDPEMQAAYEMRALINIELTKFFEAINDYDQAIKLATQRGLQTSLGELRASRAWVNFEMGNDAAANEDIEISANIEPNSENVLTNQANILGFSGKWDEALKPADRAVELHPNSPTIWGTRGLIYGYLGRWDQALADFNEAIRLQPDVSWLLTNRAWVHNAKRSWRLAITDCDQALLIDVPSEWAYASRAFAKWWLDDYEDAVLDLEQVVDIALAGGALDRPKSSRMLTIAWQDTAEDWLRALAERPSNAVAHLGRAVSLWLAGNLAKARVDWDMAVANGFDDSVRGQFKNVLNNLDGG